MALIAVEEVAGLVQMEPHASVGIVSNVNRIAPGSCAGMMDVAEAVASALAVTIVRRATAFALWNAGSNVALGAKTASTVHIATTAWIARARKRDTGSIQWGSVFA